MEKAERCVRVDEIGQRPEKMGICNKKKGKEWERERESLKGEERKEHNLESWRALNERTVLNLKKGAGEK